jgi:hypothetical protein
LFVICVVVVSAMHGHPQRRRKLQGDRAEDSERVLEPERDREAAVRYKAMEAEIDSKNAKREHSKDQEDDTRPAEERGKKRQHCERMAENKSDQGVSFEFHHVTRS